MRVIAGTAKRLILKTVEGIDTRPTTDRIKETLFNILAPELYDCRFLDLFAGSGGIGIEALSRGAGMAVFVEKNPKAMACIRENLMHTKLHDRGVTMQMDVLSALRRLEGEEAFDFIFMDPPYKSEMERQTLEALGELHLLAEGGLIITEAAKETSFDYVEGLGFSVIREKIYKTNKHIFLERRKNIW
ncbi:MAG: 16S rRNA (guanine(966)-N(2))-methyltransferase RsmD [Lachnospiraceae bacterium]